MLVDAFAEPFQAWDDDRVHARRETQCNGADARVADDDAGLRDPLPQLRERHVVEGDGVPRPGPRGSVLRHDRLPLRRELVGGRHQAVEGEV